ncbi:NAD(P)H-dependent flavin oxidoreductase [Kribbia dieselivorans]|uniref:NAD(P)H-dependent flavin oxidoreductase n=1 Tax=Kribbia dieselivorans TaxID=331526 RepID=UPI001FDF1244|nr:nitronate monooxygenase [Kribbia dieselivorans]
MSTFSLDSLEAPIVVAPMAGGPSSPELVAAAAQSGGLGFLAAGYKSADAVREQVQQVRALTDRPFGVNIFVPERDPQIDPTELAQYADRLALDAERLRVTLPTPHADDDDYDAKLEVCANEHVPVVSFTFGLPARAAIADLHDAGSAVWVTVTNPRDVRSAASRGIDALVLQGPEAGGHRSTFTAAEEPDRTPLLELLDTVRPTTDLPIVAAGGLATPQDVRDALDSGAAAVQVGTMFVVAAEAGTSRTYRDALHDMRLAPTCVTRAFSGRPARGLRNTFITTHHRWAPAIYPQVNQLTAPLRAAAGQRGDRQAVSLWAGTGHQMAKPGTTAEIFARLWPAAG